MADPAVDAVWFARGGYGSNRIAEAALADLPAAARGKLYMGYSDAGSCSPACTRPALDVAWGPMPQDVLRDGGEAAIHRALDWIVRRDPAALEPALEGAGDGVQPDGLSNLLGTPLEPDFTGVDLLIEDVSEHLYRIDRTMFHVTPAPTSAGAPAPARPGRRRAAQRPRFRPDEEAIVERLVRALGHPFRRPRRHRPRRREPGRSVRRRQSLNSPLQRHCKALRFALYRREEQQEGLMAQGRS